MVPCGVNIQVV